MVTVQQGRLTATDTTKDLANFYNDAVAVRVSDVDRIVHNGTQFARLVLRRPQAELATRGTTSGTVYTETPEYIDGAFTPNPTAGINLITISFGRLVTTTTLRVFSTSAIDATTAKWKVQTSLNNLDAEFNNASFNAAISSVVQAIVSTPAGDQFRYTITVSSPSIDSTNAGLPYWRLTHTDFGAFSNVTEVQVLPPLVPTISYFNTDGSFANSTSFEKSNILDAAYDTVNARFYTIRFNTDNVGTSSVTLNDNFSDADAGTASGTNNFNPSRWNESNTNTQFLRSSNQLSYNVATGLGQMETTFDLSGNLNVALDVIPTTLTTKQMWLALRALDSINNTIMSEGVGYETSPTVTGVWFSSRIANLVNSTASSTLRDARPLWHNAQTGTDSFTITYNGTTWSVSGTLTGALANASTGTPYNPANTPVSFLISSTASPSLGEQFTFDLITSSVDKPPTATGILALYRTGANHTTQNVILAPVTVPVGDVGIEIFGHTNGSVNIAADNFQVNTGVGVFDDVAVFTVEQTNNTGLVQGVPLIESFDVIGDPSLTYNDFLDGRVQIACTSSGTGGGEIYLKINNVLYRYSNGIALGTETGGSALTTSTDQIPIDGTSSLTWTHESGVGGLPFLTYLEFDETLQIVRLKTIDKDTLQNTAISKTTLLNISDYNNNRYKVFYDQNDFDTLYYVDSATNLRAWNVDDRISAFMAVNALDVSLPAGTSQQTLVEAKVINAWGEPLDGKTVTFAVTAGDGAVSPSTDVTVSGGLAETQFTVGSTVGVSVITATVTET